MNEIASRLVIQTERFIREKRKMRLEFAYVYVRETILEEDTHAVISRY